VPPIFSFMQQKGNVDDGEMLRVFNMGIGLMLIVAEKESREILERLEKLGEQAYLIGGIEKRENDQPTVVLN
jgi:phosphoribosylformylglycinamidine cyclo-ligase